MECIDKYNGVSEGESVRKYTKMSDEIKNELGFRVIILGESSYEVCRELDINYCTAKNMLSLFRRTGNYTKGQAVVHNNHLGISTDTACPLRLNCNKQGEMCLIFPDSLPVYPEHSYWLPQTLH